jgi:hypothetical protein
MRVIEFEGRSYRVIAEGEEDVGHGLLIDEALAVAEFARERGKRHVAVVDEESGVLVDEHDARERVIRSG